MRAQALRASSPSVLGPEEYFQLRLVNDLALDPLPELSWPIPSVPVDVAVPVAAQGA
jgi:hypothetical protein